MSLSLFYQKKTTKKLSKLLGKRFERSVHWNKNKTKKKKKNTTNKYRYFSKSNFVDVNRLFVLIYSNYDNNSKRFKFWGYYLPKGIIKHYNVIVNGKNFHDWTIDSYIKYKEIRKSTTRQGENYNTWHLLDYKYVKNNYRLIAVDLSRQRELDPDPIAIQFSKQNLLGCWKMAANTIAAGESACFNKFRRKSKKQDWNFFKCNSLIKV